MSAAAPQPQFANQAGLARLLCVSRQAIHDLVKRNIITARHDGLIDVDLARVAITSRVHPRGKTATPPPAPAIAPPIQLAKAAPAPQDTGADLSYHVAKTLREAAEAKMAQLKLAEQTGQLVRAADVKAALAAKVSALREGLLQIPPRLAAMLAAETDQARCHDLLQAELHQALAHLATTDEA